MTGAAVNWSAKKQEATALSTTEAEYMALTEAAKESIFLNRLLLELGTRQVTVGTIFCDNRSTKALAESYAFHPRTKHIVVRYHFLTRESPGGTPQRKAPAIG